MATQVSTHLSESTKERMERYVRATGTTRSHLIEQAILHHLRALEELPSEIIVPARLVLSRDSAERVRRLVERPPEPTDELKKLYDDAQDG
jgi:predicted DNA-binding protein